MTMTNHAEGLLTLVDACENAEGASVVLDRDIALAMLAARWTGKKIRGINGHV